MNSETLLISVDDIKNITAISNTIDTEQLAPFIKNAELLYIKPILGQSLYDDIIISIDENDGRYEALLTKYIYYALAYYSWYNASIFLNIKTSKKGLIKQTDNNAETISVEEFSIYSKRIESMAANYTNNLKQYLEDNKDLYLLYRSSDIVTKTTSSIFLGFKK